MSEQEDGKPLFGKSWKGTYYLVMAVLAIWIFLFYLFTINFS